jgi:hypothetical protein
MTYNLNKGNFMSARSFKIDVTRKQSNIQVIKSDSKIDVKLHNTIVFSADKGVITLNSGGYRTVTTKTAINRAFSQLNLAYGVLQKKGQWFVSKRGQTELIEFNDGMKLNVE